MDDLAYKGTTIPYTADEWWSIYQNSRQSIIDSGQTLTGASTAQGSIAMATNAATATFYEDSDTGTDPYIVSTVGSFRAPVAYFDGMLVRFRPKANNTGPPSINVAALGQKDIKKEDGVSALDAGDMTTGRDAYLRYDIAVDAFLLRSPTPEATQTSKGSVFLPDPITIANNSTDPANDIDFSGGVMIFDDGTGQTVVPPYIKQLDVAWTAGNPGSPTTPTGMLDVAPPPISNGSYFLFAIYNPTSGLADYLASASFASPNLPSGYVKKEYRGALVRGGGVNLLTTQKKNKFELVNPLTMYGPGAPPATTPFDLIVVAPTQVISEAILNVQMYSGPAGLYSVHPISMTAPQSNLCALLSSATGQRAVDNSMLAVATQDIAGFAYIRLTRFSGGIGGLIFQLDSYGWIDYSLRI